MDLKSNHNKMRAAMAAMKAGKLLSDTLGTADRSDDADVAIPEAKNKIGEGGKDEGGGSEQPYTQSDQPNGGSLGPSTGRTARSGSYKQKRY